MCGTNWRRPLWSVARLTIRTNSLRANLLNVIRRTYAQLHAVGCEFEFPGHDFTDSSDHSPWRFDLELRVAVSRDSDSLRKSRRSNQGVQSGAL